MSCGPFRTPCVCLASLLCTLEDIKGGIEVLEIPSGVGLRGKIEVVVNSAICRPSASGSIDAWGADTGEKFTSQTLMSAR